MSAKPVAILTFFCQNKAENAGRPGEGRTDVTLAVLRPNHIRDGVKGDDPNPGVFNPNGNASLQFGDVTVEFASRFKRGEKYKFTVEEVES